MKPTRLFVYSAGVFLLIASTAKLVSSFGHTTILQTYDPLTGLQFQDLFRVVASIEIAVALICFFSRQILFPAGLVAWLATSFLIYRICLNLVGYHRPCRCMGNLTDAIHISPQTADTAMKIILAYLLLGSYATLFWLWRQRKKSVSSAVGAASL
jgi:Methylamine utilisation protein MauE